MRTLEIHLLSISLGWVTAFGIVSNYVPALKLANSLVLSQFFIGMFLEYLNPQNRFSLMSLNFLLFLPDIIEAYAFGVNAAYSILIPLSGYKYPAFLVHFSIMFGLFCIFFLQPYEFRRLLNKIGFYKMAENRLPILSTLKETRKP